MRKIRTSAFFILMMVAVSMVVSCTKATLSDAELLDREQQTLKQYLQTNHISATPRASGLYYIPTDTAKATGMSPDTNKNDVVLFSYSLRLLNGNIVATNVDSIAAANQLTQPGVFYKPFEYRVKWWFGGLKEGFSLMKEGSKATFIIPSNLAYGSAGAPSLKIGGYTTVIFDINLLKVIHDPLAYQDTLIKKYIADSIAKSREVEILDSGVRHIIDVAGTGDYPADYKTVSVRYTARLIDGTLIEQITPKQLPFSYKLNTDAIIRGFDIAIRKMKKGEKAWVIIPYNQAYGEKPALYVNLPPFTTLAYYITVVDIQ